MTARFTVLASGSSGNANLVETPGFGLLIDCGLPPQELSARMQASGGSWNAVKAVVITHTHTDHWNRHTLEHLRRLNVRLFAHPDHHARLAAVPAYEPLRRAGLIAEFTADVPFEAGGLTLTPTRVPHDSDPTFAFRIDGPGWGIGLASDLGCVREELLAAFHGVDVLALEFNHDVAMQRKSRRPRFLVERVLSDLGHLSNAQAADAVAAWARAGDLAAVVQLHVSRDCNTPELAHAAGVTAVAGHSPATHVVTASQHRPIPPIPLVPRPERKTPGAVPRVVRSYQPLLPGLDA
jgi:phosphoribosyl 1,2-cyclic phosphodiesterase